MIKFPLASLRMAVPQEALAVLTYSFRTDLERRVLKGAVLLLMTALATFCVVNGGANAVLG
jgi:hypothetical protein